MADFLDDPFTDADGTVLGDGTGGTHAAPTGGAWSQITGYGGPASATINSNRVTGNVGLVNAGTPASADYETRWRGVFHTNTGSFHGPLIRASAAGATFYICYFNGAGSFKLNRSFAADIGSATSPTGISAGDTVEITIGAVGSNLYVRVQRMSDNQYWSGSAWVGTPDQCITASDSNITAAGKAGFYSSGGSGSTGWELDRITAGPDATGDTTPPTLSSAATNSGGTSITATLSESGCTADGGGSSGSGGFTLSGTSATVSSWAISGTTLTLTLSGTVTSGQTVTYDYARSGTTDDIKDAAGNYLADFSGASVTNNVSPPGMAAFRRNRRVMRSLLTR